MTFTQLAYFIAVAKHENVTKAAEELHIEQPALSRSIRRLEEDLNVSLFDRRGRVIVLNQAGKQFLEFAEQCVNSYNMIQYSMGRQLPQVSGKLTVATAVKSSRVYDILLRFQQRYPTVKLVVRHVKSPEAAYDCDFVFGLSNYETTYLKKSFLAHGLWREGICLLISTQNPLAARESIRLVDAQNELFILSLDKEFHESSDKFFQMASFTPSCRFMTDDPNLVFCTVQRNLGVALTPEFTPLYRSIEGVRLVPITVPEYYRHIFLFESRQQSGKTRSVFLEFALECCREYRRETHGEA